MCETEYCPLEYCDAFCLSTNTYDCFETCCILFLHLYSPFETGVGSDFTTRYFFYLQMSAIPYSCKVKCALSTFHLWKLSRTKTWQSTLLISRSSYINQYLSHDFCLNIRSTYIFKKKMDEKFIFHLRSLSHLSHFYIEYNC